jgi:hypothetical protein
MRFESHYRNARLILLLVAVRTLGTLSSKTANPPNILVLFCDDRVHRSENASKSNRTIRSLGPKTHSSYKRK